MNRFHVIEDAAVVLRSKGVYRQAKVYRRAEGLYAGYAGGFIRLMANGGTSRPEVSWDETDAPTKIGPLGRVEYAEHRP